MLGSSIKFNIKYIHSLFTIVRLLYIARSIADRKVRGSNPTWPNVNFSGHMKRISEAPLDQCVNWYYSWKPYAGCTQNGSEKVSPRRLER